MKAWKSVFGVGMAALALAALLSGCGPTNKPATGGGPGTSKVDDNPNGVLPTDATVLDGTYPLARPLFIYVGKESLKRPEVAAVVKFYLDNAKTLSKEVRYTPATDETYKKNQEAYAALASSAPAAAEHTLMGNVAIDGSSTVFPIAEAVAEEFRNVQKNVKLTVGFSGTGGGFKKLIAKEIDICDASRPVTKDELEKLKAAGIEVVDFTVALDGLAVIVHKDNNWVDCLTRSQLHAIWKDGSTVKTWKDVKPEWPDLPIKLYGAGTDSGTFDYFTEAINGKSKSCRKDYSPSEDDNVLVQGVENDKGALGYFGYAYYETNKAKIKLLKIDGEKEKKPEGEKKAEGPKKDEKKAEK